MQAMLRSVLAVLVGFLIFTASELALAHATGRAPETNTTLPRLVLGLAHGIVFAVAAGWITARLAGRSAIAHAMVLAMVIAAVALFQLLYAFKVAPTVEWWQMIRMFVFGPAAIVGGFLRARQVRTR
jgi:uncharacterized membrane protein